MGLNLQSACAINVLGEEDAERVSLLLRKEFGNEVPLGKPGNQYCHRDQMGWSWWHQLKQHAVQILGTSGSRHLAATDAWFAVYVDAPVDRLALRLRPEPVGVPEIAPLPQLTLVEKAHAAIGFPPKHKLADIAGRRALNEMYREFGPRAGEQAVIQVSSLPGVLGEAANLLTHHGTPLQTDEVEALLSTYADNDARIDDDPHIQCLCHLWLTATHAIKHRQPLWLVK